MRPAAISLFTGVGGLDFGFEAAGFETRVALDLDPVACKTVRLNRPWPVIEGDIASVKSQSIMDAAGLAPGEADVLIGGPPCQPFSKSGYWATGDAKRLDDPRADTLVQYLRVLRDTLPKAFLLENVMGLTYSGKSEGIQLLGRGIASINAAAGTNYQLAVKALNAAEYGVPQLRERVVLIGMRDGNLFAFPGATHFGPMQDSDEPSLIANESRYRTTWDALGDLPENLHEPELAMTGKWAELIPSIPEGNNYLFHTLRGEGVPLFGWRTRYWSFLLKLAKNLPAWTIQAQPGPATGPFHWKNRKLSAAELGRLQTFPDGVRFDCRHTDIQRLVGNAVPSALAELLAREISVQALGNNRTEAPLTLVPKPRGDTPSPEEVTEVPAKFWTLIGKHAEHPGTGKGRRASKRFSEAA